jgi:hypothetical protein
MLKTGKAELKEVYKEHNTQILLSKFLSGETSELVPVFDPKLGYRYQIAEAIAGGAAEAEIFLNRLYEAGILERRLFDRIIYCPNCKSPNTSTHYCCPYCKSFNIQRSSLIEHVKCGYMDIEQNFKKESKLICPKCHEELRKIDVDHRQAGIWCTCKECGKSFDIPAITHYCRDCHANSTFEEVIIKDIYSYSLKEEAKEQANAGWVIINPIRELLEENEFEVESPAFLKGKSGANHMFDIAAYKGKTARKTLVIDLSASSETEVSEQPVIALFAKVFDVSPDSAYLIAIPRMSDNGKKMAGLYNIQIIEAKNQKEAISALKTRIAK